MIRRNKADSRPKCFSTARAKLQKEKITKPPRITRAEKIRGLKIVEFKVLGRTRRVKIFLKRLKIVMVIQNFRKQKFLIKNLHVLPPMVFLHSFKWGSRWGTPNLLKSSYLGVN